MSSEVRASPGGWAHLAARFFQTLASRPLTESERATVDAWLRPGELALFAAQPPSDQRHALTAARWVERQGRDDLVRAALLHDLGKRHARLGVIGRVLASVAIRLRLPLRGRWAQYRDHGLLAADELKALGAEQVVVEFARSHHGPRPPSIDPHDWELLQQADRARPRDDAG